jgi:hypothetical protein
VDKLCGPESLDIASALFAIVSTILWGMSAFVSLPFGFDTDDELKSAFRKVSYLNAGGAACAAMAALLQAAKYFLKV